MPEFGMNVNGKEQTNRLLLFIWFWCAGIRHTKLRYHNLELSGLIYPYKYPFIVNQQTITVRLIKANEWNLELDAILSAFTFCD